MNKLEKALWTEKYRPQKLDDCVLLDNVREQFKGMIESNDLPHLLLSGTAGTGKTTMAKLLCNETNRPYVIYNGSSGELNIDELRNGITEFSNTVSLDGGREKIIIIDEADGLSSMIQSALRNSMEKYDNVRFILTCNYPEKIIEPIHSRCSSINFIYDKKQQSELLKNNARRIIQILKAENIEFDMVALKNLLIRFKTDNRRILNELQRYSKNGKKIDIDILDNVNNDVSELFDHLKKNDFKSIKQWIANNNIGNIFNDLYLNMESNLNKEDIPLFVLKIGEAQRYHSVVPNQELNVLNALLDYMIEKS